MKILFAIFSALLISTNAYSSVIDFEDLNTRNNFNALGIVDNYEGFEWGYGNSAGLGGRTFVNTSTGWASHTTTNTASGPMPAGISGTSAAWNWNGPQSLWIDFQSEIDFTSGLFAVLGTTYSYNASSVQLFGYDSGDTLIGTSAVLALTDTFQLLTANFSNVQYLEIRANADGQWFSVDRLVLNENDGEAPVPAPIFLLALGFAIIGFTAKRKA
ncbi:MAG: hypothetical protein ABW066_13500 [Sedimenticola sp.]